MKVGITASAFDCLHFGHMLMLKEAREQCDHLIVLLQVDPSITPKEYRGKKKNKPIMSLEERRTMLEGVKYVDDIVEYETEEDLLNFLKIIDWDIRIIGADWKGKEYTGHELEGEVYFNSRNHKFSTTELRNRIYEAEYNIRLRRDIN